MTVHEAAPFIPLDLGESQSGVLKRSLITSLNNNLHAPLSAERLARTNNEFPVGAGTQVAPARTRNYLFDHPDDSTH